MAVTLCTQKASSVENRERRLSFSSCLGRENSSINSVRLKSGCSILFDGMFFIYIKRRELFKKLELATKLSSPSKKAKQIGKGCVGCHSRWKVVFDYQGFHEKFLDKRTNELVSVVHCVVFPSARNIFITSDFQKTRSDFESVFFSGETGSDHCGYVGYYLIELSIRFVFSFSFVLIREVNI